MTPPRILALSLFLVLSCGEEEATKSKPDPGPDRQWRDEVVYQLITDRFANGDATHDDGADLGCATCYHGGDWQGVIDQLDYLISLGVTAIWISPVVENADSPLGGQAYHNYWPAALDRESTRFGGAPMLVALIDACHARGIKVIADVIVNHLGPVSFYDINENGNLDMFGNPGEVGHELAPAFDSNGVRNNSGGAAELVYFEDVSVTPIGFTNGDWFHKNGQIDNYDDWYQSLTGDFKGGLRDLNTSRADVQRALIDVTRSWIERLPFDGFRLDAAKHVHDELWVSLLPELRAAHATQEGEDGMVLFAEVFDGNMANLASFTQAPRFDSVLNFAAKYGVYDAIFKYGVPTTRFEEHHRDKENIFPDTPHPDGLRAAPRKTLFNFLDNHDVRRFLNGESDTGRLHAALAYLLTTDGIPVIYYGTEQDFSGGDDPANREPLWPSGFPQTGDTYALIAKLTGLRRELEPLRRGDTRFVFTTTHTGTETDAGMVALERYTATQRVLVVVNTSGQQSQTATGGRAMQVGFAPGTVLSDRLGSLGHLTVAADGTLWVTLPAYGAAVLTP